MNAALLIKGQVARYAFKSFIALARKSGQIRNQSVTIQPQGDQAGVSLHAAAISHGQEFTDLGLRIGFCNKPGYLTVHNPVQIPVRILVNGA